MTSLSDDDPPLSHYSPLTAAARWLFQVADRLSVRRWLCYWNPLLKPRSAVNEKEAKDRNFALHRSRATEIYIMIWLLLEIFLIVCSISFGVPQWFYWIATGLASSRIIEVVQVTVNAAIFDALSGRPEVNIASAERMIVLSVLNFLELAACFGLIYALHYTHLQGAGRPITGYYFSIINQLTIGYGDVYPTSWLRVVAAVQGLAGLSFVILVFSRFLASLREVSSVFGGSRK
jgi:hypothetical protein